MVHHAAGNLDKTETYKGLVGTLHEVLSPAITADELKCLIDSMRGHMGQLTWTEPWLFQDVIFPLLQNDRANTDDACEIWINELATLLGPQEKHSSRLFDRAREGQMTNVTAFLFASSNPARQQVSLSLLQLILRKQQHIVQKPLASTSDWTRWNDALVISMWILAFTRWGQYYLRGHNMVVPELEELSRDSCELAMIRPMEEWRSMVTNSRGELAAFLDQAEELLASNGQ